MKPIDVSLSSRPLFPLGQIAATPNALHALVEHGVTPLSLLQRHQTGDWGVLDLTDRHQNHFAIRAGLRILSRYLLDDMHKIWIITEVDRACTTILLPDELDRPTFSRHSQVI